MTDGIAAFAPGRVNLIGEHTDYNDGLALPFAVADGVEVRALGRSDRRIEAQALDLDEEDSFDLDDPEVAEDWRAYVRGVAAELTRAGCALIGANLRIRGTIPRGAGLSSSAALEVALALALLEVSQCPALDRTELARLCSRVENEWVGARTGLLDQLASLYGEEDHALRIDFRTVEVDPVPLELDGFQIVTLDSGDTHSNAASGYNERRSECARARELLGLESLRDATLEAAEGLREPLNRRVRHVITDNARVEAAIEALRDRDFNQLGTLLDHAHASLRDDYEVSTPAVEAAVGRLKAAGALGARIMGGGFGGHVLGLFEAAAELPEGAVRVSPGGGARLLAEGDG